MRFVSKTTSMWKWTPLVTQFNSMETILKVSEGEQETVFTSNFDDVLLTTNGFLLLWQPSMAAEMQF